MPIQRIAKSVRPLICRVILDRKKMDEKITIRNAELRDIPKLVEFRIKLQQHMENVNELILKFNEGWKSTLPDTYQKKITESDSLFLVAQSNENEIVGMAIGSLQKHNEFTIDKSVKIDDVWVEKKYRRKNICKRLLSEIIKHYKDTNLFALNYVEDNLEAEKTWEQLGFMPVIHYCVNYIDRKFSELKDD